MVEDGNERPPLQPSARSSSRLGLGEVDVIAPGLIHVRFAGALKLEHIEPLLETAAEQIRKGHRVLLVLDADDVHGYKSEWRLVFQKWLERNKANVEGVLALYRSPVMKMGLSMIDRAAGGIIQSFDDPEAFDVAVTDATNRAREGWLAMKAEQPVARA